MWVYIIVFIITTVLFWLGPKVKANQRIFLDSLAIVILCTLAGLRAYGVGRDTVVYLWPLMEMAEQSSSLMDYLASIYLHSGRPRPVAEIELGFNLLVYTVTALFHSHFAVQFVVEFMIIVPIYAALRKRKDVPMWFAMLVFDCIFYNASYNVMRQYIAMAFVLLAMQYFIEQDCKHWLICQICAVSFHTSALLGFAIALVYWYLSCDKENTYNLSGLRVKSANLRMVIVILGALLVLLLIEVVMKILAALGLGYYNNYLSGSIHFMPNQLIKLAPPLILLLMNFHRMEPQKAERNFFVTVLVVAMIVNQLTSVVSFAMRIAEYLTIFGIVSYPLVCRYGKQKKLTIVLMIAYLGFFWWYYFVHISGVDTVPYVMM